MTLSCAGIAVRRTASLPLAQAAYLSTFKNHVKWMDCRVQPGNHGLCAYRSEAVRSTNDWVASVAVAEPEKRSHVMPIIGSSEKLMAIDACGLMK